MQTLVVSFGLGGWTDRSRDKEVMELERPTKNLTLVLHMHRIAGNL